MNGFTIKQWAEDDQPRKKLLLKNAEALSDSELLAILINNGTPKKNALEIAKDLLSRAQNDLGKLALLSPKEMVKLKIEGLGEAKAITITAALELGVRRSSSTSKKTAITQSNEIAAYLQSKLQYKKREVFGVVLLNKGNKILHFEVISEGGITSTVADPRIILKKALEHDAVAIILCHNHPSGNLRPSNADRHLTERIKQAAFLLDIALLDHIIVSNEGYYSFADDGIL